MRGETESEGEQRGRELWRKESERARAAYCGAKKSGVEKVLRR